MTDEVLDNNAAQAQVTSAEPTDAEMKDFFDSKGGEIDTFKSEDSPEPEPEEQRAESTDQEPAEQDLDQDHEQASQNDQQRYKAMADEERIRRKETQKQIDQLRSENDQLKTTFNRILTKAQEQQEAQAPSFDDDPINALRHENQQLKTKFDRLDQENIRNREQAQADHNQQKFINSYRSEANKFKQSTPDFDDAYNFLLENRMTEYETAGYDKPQAEQLAMEDEAAIAANHLGKGTNPAEAIYKLAKLRGFQGKSSINAQDKISANKEKIATLERGLQASKTVNSGGSSSKEQLSLEAVANMDDEEFSKLDWNKVLKMG